jgi:hypothetical protein
MCQLEELVLTSYGLNVWESALDQTRLEGVYTSGMSYNDSELTELIAAVSADVGECPARLVQSFGSFLGKSFFRSHTTYYERHTNLFDFLESVDTVIHVEVKKLHPEAELPEFDCERLSDSELRMVYQSPRRMCALAIGLIEASAEHYNQSCDIKHDCCMLEGAAECQMRVCL